MPEKYDFSDQDNCPPSNCYIFVAHDSGQVSARVVDFDGGQSTPHDTMSASRWRQCGSHLQELLATAVFHNGIRTTQSQLAAAQNKLASYSLLYSSQIFPDYTFFASRSNTNKSRRRIIVHFQSPDHFFPFHLLRPTNHRYPLGVDHEVVYTFAMAQRDHPRRSSCIPVRRAMLVVDVNPRSAPSHTASEYRRLCEFARRVGVEVSSPVDLPHIETGPNAYQRAVGDSYQILHWCGHHEQASRLTNPLTSSLVLPGGARMDAVELFAYVSTKALQGRLAFLNTCDSATDVAESPYSWSRTVYDRGADGIISTIAPIESVAAAKYCTAVYKRLMRGYTVEQSMQDSCRVLYERGHWIGLAYILLGVGSITLSRDESLSQKAALSAN